MNLLLNILGVILFIAGLALAYNPELISSSPMPTDAYQSIEKRVKWGFVMGFGILLLFHHQLVPWLLTASALLLALTIGIVLARLLGIFLDGVVAKQFLWLGIELVALVLFGFWYWKQST